MIVGISVIIILRLIVVFPAEFAALTVKLKTPAVVGFPVIAPLVVFRLKPVGNVPPEIDQVIGDVPIELRVWL